MAYPPHGHVTLSSFLGQVRPESVAGVVGLRVGDFVGRGVGGEVGFLVICVEPERSKFPLSPFPFDATMIEVGEWVGEWVG